MERCLCAEAGGWQDQIAASYGGLNKITFHEEGYEVNPVIISPERKKYLNKNLMLFFTGFTRFSADIQAQNLDISRERFLILNEMQALVEEAERILTDNARNIADFGRLLNDTWKLKRGTGLGISTSEVDEIYQRGIEAGALGGKLLGAGGGGFLLFYVEPEFQSQVKEVMEPLLHIPFKFENNGTQVLYYTAETYEKV